MKKWIISISAFLSLCLIFTAAYYVSYQNVLQRFEERLNAQELAELLNSEQELAQAGIDMAALSGEASANADGERNTSDMGTAGDTAGESGRASVGEEEEQALEAGILSGDKIMPYTAYIVESYDVGTDAYVREVLRAPAELVGLTRKEAEAYFDEYMEELPLTEYQEGLASIELSEFSKQEIVVRKFYNSALVPYQYYLVVRDGLVVVYYCDKKTVFEYTQIWADSLPMETQEALSIGIGVEDSKLLYSILEGYSS